MVVFKFPSMIPDPLLFIIAIYLTITAAQMFTISDAETFLETYNSDGAMFEFIKFAEFQS